MGREIKFRGLDSMTGTWVYGNLVTLGTGSKYIIPQNVIGNEIPQWLIDRDTDGEYTGLKDKNGREIYEGDIVTYTEPAMGGFNDMTGAVEYFECAFWINDERRSFANPLFCETAELKVIGNIFENPGMLEGQGARH